MIEQLVKLLVKPLQSVIDGLVEGEQLTEEQRKILYSGYVAVKTWMPDIVADTANTYDDAALEILLKSAEDTMNEAGIIVPVLPEF